MAEKDDNQAPIVIKKKKGGEEEEGHGGAWKVAYADFVTAMMAFFLLMWLLNATTEEQQSGIADYFSPVSASESTSGGGGVLSGQTAAKDGALTSRNAPVGMNMDVPAAPPTKQGDGEENNSGEENEDGQLKAAELKIRETFQDSGELSELQKNVEMERSDSGLRIRIMDRIEQTMFKQGSTEPRPGTRELLQKIAENISGLPNPLVIKGHTDGTSFGGGAEGYSNWELSSERANAARRILVSAGVEADRIAQVVGAADQNLLMPEDPTNPRNRRISILLVSQQARTVATESSALGGGAVTPVSAPEDAGEAQQSEDSGGAPESEQQPGGPSLFDIRDGS